MIPLVLLEPTESIIRFRIIFLTLIVPVRKHDCPISNSMIYSSRVNLVSIRNKNLDWVLLKVHPKSMGKLKKICKFDKSFSKDSKYFP